MPLGLEREQGLRLDILELEGHHVAGLGEFPHLRGIAVFTDDLVP